MAWRIDARAGEFRSGGPCAALLMAVLACAPSGGGPQASTVSGRGSAPTRPLLQLVHIDAAGTRTPLDVPPAQAFAGPKYSPDGRRLGFTTVVDRRATQLTPRVYEFDSKRVIRSPEVSSLLSGPVWSPDGEALAYLVRNRTGIGVVTRPIGGGGSADTVIMRGDGRLVHPIVWSGAGELYVRVSQGGSAAGVSGGQLMILAKPDGRWLMRSAPVAAVSQRHGDLSRDGRWFIYESVGVPGLDVAAGTPESASTTGPNGFIYLQSLEPLGEPRLISERGGSNPRWSADGRTVYYWEAFQRTGGRATGTPPTSAGATLVAATVEYDPAPRVSSWRRLFSVPVVRPDYAVHPTRDEFVVVLPVSAGTR